MESGSRKQANRQTRRHARLLEAALERVDEAVVITTKEIDWPGPEIVYVNEAFCRMSGYSVEEIVGKTPRILQGPKTDRAELGRLRRLLSQGEPYRGEAINYRKDGSEYLLAWHIEPLRDEAGEVTHWVSGQRDVTEQRRARKALKESEARYRTVVGNAPVVLFALDAEGVFTLSEGKGLEALGLGPGEVVGRSVFEVYGDAPEICGHVRRALGGEEVSATVRLGPLAFEAFYGPLRDEDGGVAGVIGVAADVTERERARERLRHRALHDPLTDLPNRTLFLDRLEHALSPSNRRRRPGAVLFMDLDDFKAVNDSFGHEAGDALLLEAAERLRAHLRPEDTAARFGGDEFAVLIEDVAEARDATRVAERILEGMRRPFVVEGREVSVSASIGIALAAASPSEGPEDLLRGADTAMYAAKEGGKARHEVFDPGMRARVLERLELENDLRRALERGELRIHYQPKVLLESGGTVGFEALLRWERPGPGGGLLAPSQFVPVAEESGLIVPIGRWVLEEACRQAKVWQERHRTDPPLAMCVNLSARQFRHPRLVQDLAQVLQGTGLDPASLHLEITESTLMAHTEPNLATLGRLKRLGAKLAIDDFGTGYSSLSYLKRMPVDFLKIDRSFVEGLGSNRADAEIVSAIVNLAHVLGIGVIAEGVETAEQVERLREMGCRFAQGRYFSRPLPAEVAGAHGSFSTESNPSSSAP